jgi:hypothetical protein
MSVLVWCAAHGYDLLQFANRKNVHCVSMASLGGAKLANPLMTKASHSSLGSAKAAYGFQRYRHGAHDDVPIRADPQRGAVR